MDWLDKKVEKNAKSPGRNKSSDMYYETLLKIRDAQNNNVAVDDSLYRLVGFGSVDYGYYTANISYDLFEGTDDKDSIEERIINFMETIDHSAVEKDGVFALNFMREFKFYLSNFVYPNIKNITPDWIKEFGSEKEKKIIQLFEEIIN